jgi:hypothetical protein
MQQTAVLRTLENANGVKKGKAMDMNLRTPRSKVRNIDVVWNHFDKKYFDNINPRHSDLVRI